MHFSHPPFFEYIQSLGRIHLADNHFTDTISPNDCFTDSYHSPTGTIHRQKVKLKKVNLQWYCSALHFYFYYGVKITMSRGKQKDY